MKRALANKNSYSSHLVAEHAALWTCAFHGRSKRVTLYLLGCDVYQCVQNDIIYLHQNTIN